MTSMGKVSFHENDLAAAKKILAETLAREEIPDAYVYAGFIHYQEGDKQAAEKEFANAAGLSGNSPEVLHKIGRFFSAKGEYTKANVYYKMALEKILDN
jgi:Tfp pilus assembly protein PilF